MVEILKLERLIAVSTSAGAPRQLRILTDLAVFGNKVLRWKKAEDDVLVEMGHDEYKY